MFSPEELKALEDSDDACHRIGQFVRSSVDPLYFDGTYYVAPDKGGASPIHCSPPRCAKRSNVPSAAGFPPARTYRHHQGLGDGLAMHQLYFKAEVRDLKD